MCRLTNSNPLEIVAIPFELSTNRCPFCNKDLSYLDNYIFRAQHIAYKHFQSDHLMAQNLLKKAKEINISVGWESENKKKQWTKCEKFHYFYYFILLPRLCYASPTCHSHMEILNYPQNTRTSWSRGSGFTKWVHLWWTPFFK